jgi:hypothetical protein
MTKQVTVFYSWQSDTSPSINRNFIEKALLEAIKRLQSDATLESALRDTRVELDKDTKGVAGSPPIAETILRKIEECEVFVADLTFVGQSITGLTKSADKPRLIPNPNVLIEYGFALRCHSHAAIVGVMNTAFGEANADTLPFDLRHLRWPVTYHLSDSSAIDKTVQVERLTTTLVEALRLILARRSTTEASTASFAPQKPTKSAALFHEDVNDLIPEARWGQKRNSYSVPEGGKAYLRLYPTESVPPMETELEAEDAARQGGLRPFGRVSGWSAIRNVFGAIAYEAPHDGKLYHFTQLFLSREIWSVDARILNADYHRERQKEWGGTGSVEYIASGYIEEHFVEALENFLSVAKSHLKLQLPLRVEAGLVGIKGYSISVNSNDLVGNALRDVVHWTGEIATEKPAWDILEPFFDRIWAACGIKRSARRQAELAKKFDRRN